MNQHYIAVSKSTSLLTDPSLQQKGLLLSTYLSLIIIILNSKYIEGVYFFGRSFSLSDM